VFIDIRDPSPAALTCGDVELSPSHVNGRRRLRVELGRSLELLRDAEQLAPPKHLMIARLIDAQHEHLLFKSAVI
jgi:hypothetical protein